MPTDWYLRSRVFASITIPHSLSRRTGAEALRELWTQFIEPTPSDPLYKKRLSWKEFGGNRSHSRRNTGRSWEMMLNHPKKPQWMMIDVVRDFPGEYPAWAPIAGTVYRVWETAPAGPATIEFDIDRIELGARLTPEWQSMLVEWACGLFASQRGLVGYITLDAVMADVYGGQSPYERATQLDYHSAESHFDKKVRGYYWGNLLNEAHVELLGGANVLARSPVHEVRSLPNGGYYLQATPTIDEMPPKTRQMLRQFLSPLLPRGHRPLEAYKGPPYYAL